MKFNRLQALSFNIHLGNNAKKIYKNGEAEGPDREILNEEAKTNFVRVPVIQLNRLSNGFANESDQMVPNYETYNGYHRVDSPTSSEELIVV